MFPVSRIALEILLWISTPLLALVVLEGFCFLIKKKRRPSL